MHMVQYLNASYLVPPASVLTGGGAPVAHLFPARLIETAFLVLTPSAPSFEPDSVTDQTDEHSVSTDDSFLFIGAADSPGSVIILNGSGKINLGVSK